MLSWIVLASGLLLQDPLDDLKKELEQVKKDNAELRERVTLLDKQTSEDARVILRLRQALKLHEGGAAAPPPVAPVAIPDKPAEGEAPSGPLEPLRAKVDYVDAKQGFVVINKGERHGVKTGFKFEILRETFEGQNAAARLTKIAVAEFQKFLGQEHLMSMLKVVEGNPGDVRVEDEAVAYRRIDPRPAAPALPPAEAAKAQGLYRITGTAGKGFVLNYGTADGARQTDVVMVYKDGKLKAKLRLDTVERTFSVGQVIDNTLNAAPEVDDQVFTQELKKAVIGKVQLIDEKRGIFVDVGSSNFNVNSGQRLEVRRQGQRVGTITLVQVEKFWSWARPDGQTRHEDLKKGDHVELIAEKQP